MSLDVMSIVRSVDYHCHTYHSPCGQPEMIPEVVLRKAESLGIKKLGFTDHWYRHLLHQNDFQQVRDECAGWSGGVDVYFGCEAEVTNPDQISIFEDEAQKFDYILLSASHFQNAGIVEAPASLDPEVVTEYFLAMLYKAATIPFVDVIPHPFFAPGNTYRPSLATDRQFLKIIEAAKANEIAMEISPRALTPSLTPFVMRFYKLCKKVGLKFSIGSDSHRLVTLGMTADLEPIIRELELTENDLWHPSHR